MKDKSLLYIVAGGVGLLLILLFIIMVLGLDPDRYIGSLGSIIAVLASSGILARLLQKNTATTETVKHQTNGTLSALRKELAEEARMRRELEEQVVGLQVATGGAVVVTPAKEYPPLMSEDTLSGVELDGARHSA